MCLTMVCGLLPLLNLTSTAIALFLVLSFDIDLCGDPVLLSLHLHHIEIHYTSTAQMSYTNTPTCNIWLLSRIFIFPGNNVLQYSGNSRVGNCYLFILIPPFVALWVEFMQLILSLSTKVQLLNDTAKRCDGVVYPLLGYDLLGCIPNTLGPH